jgi:hypothetical protein
MTSSIGSDALLPRTLTAIAAPWIVNVRAHATGAAVGVGAGVGVGLVVEVGMAVAGGTVLVAAGAFTAGIQMLEGVPTAAACVASGIRKPHAVVSSALVNIPAMAMRGKQYFDVIIVIKGTCCGRRRRAAVQRFVP